MNIMCYKIHGRSEKQSDLPLFGKTEMGAHRFWFQKAFPPVLLGFPFVILSEISSKTMHFDYNSALNIITYIYKHC